MPARTNLHQAIVFLAKQHRAPEDASVEESAMVLDAASGEHREVDVVIRGRVGDDEVVVSVEVVSWKRKAGLPWVEQMIAKHSHMPTGHLYLVSWSGFTAGARERVDRAGGSVVAVHPEIIANAKVTPDLWCQVISPELDRANLVVHDPNVNDRRGIVGVPLDSHVFLQPSRDSYLCTIRELVNRMLTRDGGADQLSKSAYDQRGDGGEDMQWFTWGANDLDQVLDLYVYAEEAGFLQLLNIEIIGPLNLTRRKLDFTACRMGGTLFAFAEYDLAGKPAVFVMSPTADGGGTGSWRII